MFYVRSYHRIVVTDSVESSNEKEGEDADERRFCKVLRFSGEDD